MQEITERTKCTGCHACLSACPSRCITMQPDEAGFLYPSIDALRCTDCGLCKKACPVEQEYVGEKALAAYACIANDEAVRAKSSSGGMFTLLASEVLHRGGVVIGAAWDDEGQLIHMVVQKEADLPKLQGSKYLQSRIGNVLKETKAFLEAGRTVYFSGTPCQIGGLKAYLRKPYPNLICQDIICHGVPSPKTWSKYLAYVCETSGKIPAELCAPEFRDKDHGWLGYRLKIGFSDGTSVSRAKGEDLYMQAFLNNYGLRPSCYNCHFKSAERESDIMLADFWGVDKILPQMFDDKGTSLVLVYSEKGKALFDSVKAHMACAAVDPSAALAYNASACQSAAKPKQNELFLRAVESSRFDTAVHTVLKKRAAARLQKKARSLLRRAKTKLCR